MESEIRNEECERVPAQRAEERLRIGLLGIHISSGLLSYYGTSGLTAGPVAAELQEKSAAVRGERARHVAPRDAVARIGDPREGAPVMIGRASAVAIRSLG